MKLSMWNIYNQLEMFEPDISINKESPMVLKSARLVYATDCIVISSYGSDSIGKWQDDYIRLHNISASETLALIQNIFDRLSDWHSNMFNLISEQNFQGMVDLCHDVFNNPVIFFDVDFKVLGISSQYDEDSLDTEWYYLKTFHASSFKALNELNQTKIIPDPPGPLIREPVTNSGVVNRHLSLELFYKDKTIGRISIVEKNRAFNYGDIQMLELIAKMVKSSLFNYEQQNETDMPFTNKLVKGISLNDEDCQQLQHIFDWQKAHIYQIYFLYFKHESEGTDDSQRILLNRIIYSLYKIFPRDLFIIYNNYIFFLCNNSIYNCNTHQSSLYEIAIHNNMHVACSLPLCGIRYLPQLVDQVNYAKNFGEIYDPTEINHYFYNYAIDYLITTPFNSQSHIMACHPNLSLLYQQTDHNSRILYETLLTYLENERSSKKTTDELYIHKNTLSYRRNKIEEFLNCNLEDAYTRKYLLISFSLLERNSLYIQAQHFKPSPYDDCPNNN